MIEFGNQIASASRKTMKSITIWFASSGPETSAATR